MPEPVSARAAASVSFLSILTLRHRSKEELR
jgi:hypothetical protein